MFGFPGLGSLWQLCRHQGLSGIHSKLEGYFFPWHFAAEAALRRKLRSVALPNMSFLLLVYFISTGKEGRCRPRRASQWECSHSKQLLAMEILIRRHGSQERKLLVPTSRNLCFATGHSLTTFYVLLSYFRRIVLVLVSCSWKHLSLIKNLCVFLFNYKTTGCSFS